MWSASAIRMVLLSGVVVLAAPCPAWASDTSGEAETNPETASESGEVKSPAEPEAGPDGGEQSKPGQDEDPKAVPAKTQAAPDAALEDDDEDIEEVEDVVDVSEAAPVDGFDGQNRPSVDRAVNALTARTIRPGALLFSIDHRTHQSFMEGGGELWHDYLGFDSAGLKIGLGFRFGILEGLDLGLYRLNNTAEVFDSYEIDVRYRFLKQADHFVDMAARAGFTGFVHPGDIYAIGYLGQILIDHVFADQLLFGLGVLFHSDSTNDVKSIDDTNWSLAVSAVVEWRFLPWMAWDLEVAANVAGYGSEWPVFSTSIKMLTHRHTYSIIVSNNQYMGADGLVANTWRGFDDLVIGFQITREFNLF